MVEISEERNPLKSENKKLRDYWKERVISSLRNMYGDNGIHYDKVNIFLDNIIAKTPNIQASMRNIYTNTNWDIDLDTVLQMVNKEKLIIGANGTFTVRHSVKVSEFSELLVQWLKERSELKNKAIECEEKGDVAGLMKFDNLQNSKKELNNSVYGVSAMNGYILYSPDSASMITQQGRELISEMMWTLEKLLSSNLCFTSMNEFYLYLDEIINTPIDIELIKKYNITIPNMKMLTNRLNEMLLDIPANEKEGIDNNKSLFLMLKNISKDPVKSINFYYRYNLYQFFILNPKIMEYVNFIMREKKEFKSPDIKVMKKEESAIYIAPIEELTKLLMDFVVVFSPTYGRVDKYINRGRKIIPISDTDSVIVKLSRWIDFVSNFSEVKFDTFYDEEDIYRAANTISYIATEICNIMARNMARNCYVEHPERYRMNLKNEFFFKSLILFPNIKKNYSAWITLREGASVNKVSNTGLALTGSNINPFVKKYLDALIFDEIHSVKDISITRIMKKVYDLEDIIRHKTLIERDVSFGVFSSYKNSNKVNPYSDNRIRGVELWNHIYPKDKIESYNKIYMFNTILEKESQLYLIKDETMREYLRDRLFKNPVDPSSVKFGLRSIAIPDKYTKFPEWMVDIVDINKIIEGHVNPITSLIPSMGMYTNRRSSNRSTTSPLLSL